MMTRAAWVGLFIGMALLAAGYWWLREPKPDALLPDAEPALTPDVPLAPEATSPEAATPRHPLAIAPPNTQADAAPLPPLEESDAEAASALRELFGEPLDSLLVPRDLIRRVVLLVDALDRDPLPLWLRPLRRVPGTLAVVEAGESVALADVNTQRYEPYVSLFERVDARALAALYQRAYPLFQDAYDRIGNPRARYFNDRVIDIIDHLLATPAVEEPVALVRVRGLWRFADPDLEARSFGQKTLLRMGRVNAARVQAKLRELRSAILALPAA